MNKGFKIFLCMLLGIGVICGVFAVANKLNERAMNEYIDGFGKAPTRISWPPSLTRRADNNSDKPIE